MAAPAAVEPRRFGKYQILERIASGGMAEIFRARLDGIGGFQRSFAIKRIAPHLSQHRDFVDMLVDEAKVAGLLSHANIVQILDLGSVDQQFYIAMEFVNGRDLRQVLQRTNEKGITLPVPHAVFVLIEMLKGLEYAHNRQVMRGGKPVPLNIVHRDIAPGNVLLSFQGEVKLTDFGIAKASVKALETASGVVKGRFDYMSPEQAAGKPLDQRSDIFSAGVLFYEVLTGRHPFRQATELGTIDAIRRGAYVPPSEVNPDVPYSLDLVVEQALRARPEERLQTATAFKEGLDRFFHDSGFIFSASTLAAFLRGLFPELVVERKPVGDAVTRPLDTDEVSLDPDESSSARHRPPLAALETEARSAPQRQADDSDAPAANFQAQLAVGRAPPDPGASASNTAVALLRAGAGPVVNLADESTFIRSGATARGEENPFEGEVATQIRSQPAAVPTADGQETLRLSLDRKRLLEVPPDETPPDERAVLPFQPSEAAAPPRPRGKSRQVGVPVEVHMAWLLVVFAAAVAAFVLGLLIGARMRSAPAPAPQVVVSPEN